VDSGDAMSHTIPVYEGHAIRHGVKQLEFGGKELTHRLQKLLSERGYHFGTTVEIETIRDMKEKLAYIALDFEERIHHHQ
jgi:actin-related protein